jgi:hypothetical protein
MRVNGVDYDGKYIDAQDGKYIMDGETYDNLGDLLAELGFERVENIEDQIRDQAEEMKKRNKMLDAYSQILSVCRAAADNTDEKRSSAVNLKRFTFVDPETGEKINGKEFLERYGPWPIPGDRGKDGLLEKEAIEAAIELIKGKMDSLNSDSQMDMTRLQGLMGKRDNVFQSISSPIKTDQRSRTNAINNLK